MKKDRNVGGAAPYAMYPTYQGMQPGMPMQGMPMQPGMPMQGMPMQGMPMQPGMPIQGMPQSSCGCPMSGNMNPNQGAMTQPGTAGNTNNGSSSMQDQINQLDRRVSRLESVMSDQKSVAYSNNTNFTDANYHMM